MIEYFKQLFNKKNKTENYYNLRIDWIQGDEYIELKKILKNYPGSALSKESVDENGQYLPPGTRGIIFPNDIERQNFLNIYQAKYNAFKINGYLPTKIKAPLP